MLKRGRSKCADGSCTPGLEVRTLIPCLVDLSENEANQLYAARLNELPVEVPRHFVAHVEREENGFVFEFFERVGHFPNLIGGVHPAEFVSVTVVYDFHKNCAILEMSEQDIH